MSYDLTSIISIKDEEIWQKAEDFRELFERAKCLPVPICDIIELDMAIRIIPIEKMLDTTTIEACLSRDCKTIFVDKERYSDPGWEQRSRFTLAHEVGHLAIHKKIYSKMPLDSLGYWVNFRQNNSLEITLIEKQADQFAGRLLVPKKQLLEQVQLHHDVIAQKLREKMDIDHIKVIIALYICEYFGTTGKVVYGRIKIEKIFELLNII